MYWEMHNKFIMCRRKCDFEQDEKFWFGKLQYAELVSEGGFSRAHIEVQQPVAKCVPGNSALVPGEKGLFVTDRWEYDPEKHAQMGQRVVVQQSGMIVPPNCRSVTHMERDKICSSSTLLN